MPRLTLLPFVWLVLAGHTSAADAPAQIPPDLVVAADGTGDFKSIQSALESIPRDNRERRIVAIKPGTYHEKIRVDPPFVTLRGQDRENTRIEFPQGADEFEKQPDKLGRAVVNISGDDCVIANLTVENTHGVIGKHAFAVYGKGDRTVIIDANVYSQGNDTLSLWLGDRGRYYHARLNIRGSVDFVCPRGWCYMKDSTLYEVNPQATGALWHDGSKNRDMKFVLRNCRLDGVTGWVFARHHHDAQFFLVDCIFSAAMRDAPPRRVIYPLNGAAPSEADRKRNQELDRTNVWGERFYFFNCHREGGDYAWHPDNLSTALGQPKPEQITAAWTFGGTWDPERMAGPAVVKVDCTKGGIDLVFSESASVKGRPRLVLNGGRTAEYTSGSGTANLRFHPSTGVIVPPLSIDLNAGNIIATEASATLRLATLTLPAVP